MDKYYVIVIDDDDDGNEARMVRLDSENIGLEDLYKFANCDTIQIIQCLQFPHLDLLMCIDDNGKLEDKPINSLATYLYGQFPTDFIVGKAVLGVRQRSEFQEPDMYGIPEYECKAYMTLLNLLQ